MDFLKNLLLLIIVWTGLLAPPCIILMYDGPIFTTKDKIILGIAYAVLWMHMDTLFIIVYKVTSFQ